MMREAYGRKEDDNVGTIASPRRFFDTQYGVSKDGEQLMIIDTRDNFTIRGTVFKGTEGLWELLTRKNLNSEVINMTDLKT